jgi:uncharacterized repeat protein (TIGR01451 family)
LIPKILFSRKIMLMVCCVFLMMSLLGVDAQAGRLSLPSRENFASPDAPDAGIIHTTVTDFDQMCAVRTNAHISDNLGGSVELAGALNDTFDGTTLDSTRWISGSWAVPPIVYTPVVSGGKLTLPPRGYVSSNAVFTRGVISGKIEFTQGNWQQVGFGAPDLVNDLRYLFFSTLDTALTTPTLYARVGLSTGAHDEPISALPTGTHRYGIQWLASNATNDLANYFYDGASIYTSLPFSNTLISNFNLWMSNNGTLNLTVDEIQVAPPYATSGDYVSCPLDAGAANIWQTASWVTSVPASTTLTVQTHTSPDGLNWTTWATVPTSGGYIASPDRYVEYKILLGTTNVSATAALDSISLTTTGASADLNLTKTVSNSTPDVGSEVDFTVTVNNDGPSTATKVEVKDQLPSGYTFSSASAPPGTYDDASGIWTVGTIPATGSAVLTIHAVVNASGIYSNAAEVTKSEIFDPDSEPGNGDITEDDYETITPVPVPVADLELEKVARSLTAVMGSTQVFTVTVTNKGPSQATGVKVKDLLESGYQFVGATASQETYDPESGEWTVGVLALNQSATLRLTSTVKTTGTYNNYAQVIASNEPDPDSKVNDNSTTQDDDASVTVGAVPGADLSLIKQTSKSAPYVGESVVFTVTVTNAGPNPATGVTVKDFLNSGYTFVSSNQPGSYDAQTGMWDVGTLQVSEIRQLAVTAQVKPTGNYQNIAEVWQSQVLDPDSSPQNGVITEDDFGTITPVPVPVADLSIVKTLITVKPEIGKEVVFQIRVINAGPNSAGGVTISDVIPANHVFVSSDHTAVNNSGTLTWNLLDTIPANQEVVIQLILQANATGSYSNQVQVLTSNEYDPDSRPGNSAVGEDDLASVQYSVNYYLYLPVVIKNP